jgi:predicted GIY-YIG superfamily endonuclease
MFYVYFLECRDGSFYCGYTNNLENRIKLHNSGKGSKYVKKRRPARLIYFEKFDDKSSAMKREYALKQLSRKEKESLIYS